MNHSWTIEENKLLEQGHTLAELVILLPNRTRNAISQKVWKRQIPITNCSRCNKLTANKIYCSSTCKRSDEEDIRKERLGETFGYLTIVGYTLKEKYNNSRKKNDTFYKCKCQCKCGNTVIHATYGDLKSGKYTSCGCERIEKHTIPIGTKFGLWTVKSKPISKDGLHYECECDCGTKKIKYGGDLRTKGKNISCGCLNRTGYKDLGGAYFKSLKRGAMTRGLEWDLEDKIEELWDMYIRQQRKCAESGMEILLSLTRGCQTASLDRIDPTKGYTIDNVQWVHKDINKLKMDFQPKYFRELCKKVTNYAN